MGSKLATSTRTVVARDLKFGSIRLNNQPSYLVRWNIISKEISRNWCNTGSIYRNDKNCTNPRWSEAGILSKHTDWGTAPRVILAIPLPPPFSSLESRLRRCSGGRNGRRPLVRRAPSLFSRGEEGGPISAAGGHAGDPSRLSPTTNFILLGLNWPNKLVYSQIYFRTNLFYSKTIF